MGHDGQGWEAGKVRTVGVGDDAGVFAEVGILLRGHVHAAQVVVIVEAERAVVTQRAPLALARLLLRCDLYHTENHNLTRLHIKNVVYLKNQLARLKNSTQKRVCFYEWQSRTGMSLLKSQ